MMTAVIVIVFLLGYLLISMESNLKINKTAIALLLSVFCWMLYMMQCGSYVNAIHAADFAKWQHELADGASATAASYVINKIFIGHVGDTSEIIFFLLGAMTIVETVDANGGFDFVRERLNTKSQRALLWRISFMTFALSAVLDNMTTAIVMIMVLRKLVQKSKLRLYYAGMVVLAANAGGSFSPIGDVTTIMLWIKGNITSIGVVKEVLLPSIACLVVPLLILSRRLNGELVQVVAKNSNSVANVYDFSKGQRYAVFYVGVCGLVFVPVFRSLTGLPPFMGIMFVFSVLWVMTEFYYRHRHISSNRRVGDILHQIDISTILFFLGILMAVAALQETGALSALGQILERCSNGNAYIVTGVIGVVSSIVDNVPLVASCMGMYDIATQAQALINPELQNLVVDGTFWQLLAYCAGTGGSLLIIGSAAGVIVMGLEKISFGWYLRHFSLLALSGFLSGIFVYWLEKTFLF